MPCLGIIAAIGFVLVFPHPDAVQWAIDTYAEKSAGDLELLSTIVCADRAAHQARRQMAFEELGRKVQQSQTAVFRGDDSA